MKISNKIVGVIAGVSAVVIGGSVVAANILLKDDDGQEKNPNPLNRDKTYHRYSLVNKISKNEKINNLITLIKENDNITYIVDEDKFLSNIKIIVQEALKTIPAFSSNYLNYQIDCNYKVNTKSILVDLVWYEEKAKNKYFDQFEFMLQTM